MYIYMYLYIYICIYIYIYIYSYINICEETTTLEDSLHDGRWCCKAHPYGVIDLEFRGTIKKSDTPCTSDQLFERLKQRLNTIVQKRIILRKQRLNVYPSTTPR